MLVFVLVAIVAGAMGLALTIDPFWTGDVLRHSFIVPMTLTLAFAVVSMISMAMEKPRKPIEAQIQVLARATHLFLVALYFITAVFAVSMLWFNLEFVNSYRYTQVCNFYGTMLVIASLYIGAMTTRRYWRKAMEAEEPVA